MIIVANVLPALRVAIAQQLIKTYKLKPIEVAQRMDVTPAAVTQYMKGSRGKGDIAGFLEDRDVQALAFELASTLARNGSPTEVLRALCNLCENIRRKGLLCDQCKSTSQMKMVKGCNFCAGRDRE